MRNLCLLSVQANNNVPLTEEDKDKALHAAIRKGKVKRVQKLLGEGASPIKKNGDGLTALDTAAIAGKVKCFKLVFNEASDIERRGDDHQSHVEQWNGALESLKSLEADEEAKDEQLQRALKELSAVQCVEAFCNKCNTIVNVLCYILKLLKISVKYKHVEII